MATEKLKDEGTRRGLLILDVPQLGGAGSGLHQTIFVLPALNAGFWVGLKVCLYLLLCLMSSWCVSSLEPGCWVNSLNFSLSWMTLLNNISVLERINSFIGIDVHSMTQPPRITVLALLEEHRETKSGSYCCWREYCAGCWPKANSWPLLTSNRAFLPAVFLKSLNILGILTALFSFDINFVMQVNSHSYSSLSTPLNTLNEWVQD